MLKASAPVCRSRPRSRSGLLLIVCDAVFVVGITHPCSRFAGVGKGERRACTATGTPHEALEKDHQVNGDRRDEASPGSSLNPAQVG